jgi:DegV family protein with EDD domain
MSKVAIVIDSTAYLPEELVKQYNITVLPLSIIWDSTSYRDGVDIQPEEFYRRLQTSRALPTTSQVSAPAMQSAFADRLAQGSEVLGIFLSSIFSGTYAAALQARETIPGALDKIAVVDSQLTTMAMGLTVIAAARAAQAGESLSNCRKVAEEARNRSGVLFVVETLEFLRRGGRIGGAQALLGSVLNIKPVLAMRDGQIEALERIRTRRAALERVVDIVTERIGSLSAVQLAASHANAGAEAAALLASARARLNPVETFCRPLSPVIGAHVGPGTVALAYMAGMG